MKGLLYHWKNWQNCWHTVLFFRLKSQVCVSTQVDKQINTRKALTSVRDTENTFSLSPSLLFYSSSKQWPCHGLHYIPKSVAVNGLFFLRGRIQSPAHKTNTAWNTYKHEQQRGLFYIWTIQSITVSFFAPAFSKNLTTIYCLKKKP